MQQALETIIFVKPCILFERGNKSRSAWDGMQYGPGELFLLPPAYDHRSYFNQMETAISSVDTC